MFVLSPARGGSSLIFKVYTCEWVFVRETVSMFVYKSQLFVGAIKNIRVIELFV